MLVHNFKGHSTDIVKECAKIFKSGDETDDNEDYCKLINFSHRWGYKTKSTAFRFIFRKNNERLL